VPRLCRTAQRSECAPTCAAAHDHHRAATEPLPHRARAQQHRAGNQEQHRQRVEERLPAVHAGGRVAHDGQGAQCLRVGHAVDQQVLLRVVHREVERGQRAGPVIVRDDLHAGDQQDVRQARLRLRHARQVRLDSSVERAFLTRHARQGTERGQAVLDAEPVVLGEQERADPLPIGQAHQAFEREITGRDVGVDVDDAPDPLQRRAGRSGRQREEQGQRQGAGRHRNPRARASRS